jgi:hypothetical protein
VPPDVDGHAILDFMREQGERYDADFVSYGYLSATNVLYVLTLTEQGKVCYKSSCPVLRDGSALKLGDWSVERHEATQGFETLSVWMVAYGGVPPGELLAHYRQHCPEANYALIKPEHLHGQHVIAWQGREKSVASRTAPVGPATGIMWCAGHVAGQTVKEFWANHGKEGDDIVFRGSAEFKDGTLYLKGRVRGAFRDITEGCFFEIREQDAGSYPETGESYPVVVTEEEDQ